MMQRVRVDGQGIGRGPFGEEPLEEVFTIRVEHDEAKGG